MNIDPLRDDVKIQNKLVAKQLGTQYLATIWNINGMVHFINTNNIFNAYVERNNESNILFTKSDFN